ISPTIGGFVIAGFGWRSLFIMITAGGLLLIAMVLFLLPETHNPDRQPDRAGAIIGRIPRNCGLLLRVPRLAAYAVMPGFLSGTFFALATASSFLARENLGVSTEAYGLWFLFLPGGFLFGTFMSGRIGNRASIGFMTTGGTLLNVLVVLGFA